MAKANRKRKQKRRKSTRRPRRVKPQQRPPELSRRQRLIQWLYKHARATIATLSAFVTLLMVFGFFYDLVRQPEIGIQPVQTDEPYQLFFSLRNPSRWFAVKDADLNCRFIVSRGRHFDVRNIESSTGVYEISPKKTLQVQCRELAVDVDYQVITLEVSLDYRTMWLERESDPVQFNWNSVSRQWIKGEGIYAWK